MASSLPRGSGSRTRGHFKFERFELRHVVRAELFSKVVVPL
ncbi:hypothetical protein QA639_34330 [Bradyrhizobium pachyrhizi]|nr:MULTISPECIES: hypothetical protein [Bradyrhizobium]WFU54630.1 hypothetical protein QA639_34330 [Bradyrhizobium pachyrhizi]WOH80271.1 hypothetical protein RX327_31335 [Bradyrhizobium sp. BEA-2-5]